MTESSCFLLPILSLIGAHQNISCHDLASHPLKVNPDFQASLQLRLESSMRPFPLDSPLGTSRLCHPFNPMARPPYSHFLPTDSHVPYGGDRLSFQPPGCPPIGLIALRQRDQSQRWNGRNLVSHVQGRHHKRRRVDASDLWQLDRPH